MEFKQKLGAFLQRRGFNYEVVHHTLERLIEDITADEPDFFAESENDWF
jgi:SOS response regulatory protein OraA/RecX